MTTRRHSKQETHTPHDEANKTISKPKQQPHYGCWCTMMNPVTGEEYIPTTVEQIANTVTHGIPAIFAVVALVFMLVYVVDTPLEALVAWIYGICMILLFSVSSLYHLFTLTHTMDHKLAQFFQTFDHAAIYIFIAASYTPWLLLLEIGANGWIGQLFCLFVWGIAVFGVVKSFTKFAKSISGLVLYLFMGWVVILIVKPIMISEVAVWGVLELIIGGLFYTAGAVGPFNYDGRIPFAHAIWHLFVVVAAAIHFHSVYIYLIGSDNYAHVTEMTKMKDMFGSLF